jgi:hypothetical protein
MELGRDSAGRAAPEGLIMTQPDGPHASDCACAYCGVAVGGPVRDYAHRWPDRVFALSPRDRASRTWCWPDENPDFVALDGEAFFVRGLLPVPLEANDEFRYGVWLEVSQADFERILQAWNDEQAYATLRFQATLANAIAPWGERTLATTVAVSTRDAGTRPWVSGADDEWLATLLRAGWDRSTYERVARSLSAAATGH